MNSNPGQMIIRNKTYVFHKIEVRLIFLFDNPENPFQRGFTKSNDRGSDMNH